MRFAGDQRAITKWRRFALLSCITAVVVAVACNEKATAPTAPKAVVKSQPAVRFTMNNDGEKIGPISYNGFPQAPTANPQRNAYDWCIGHLLGTAPLYSDQVQALVWDSTTPARAGGDTLFRVRLKIKYRVWNGMYADGEDIPKTLRCIRLDSIFTYRATAHDTGWGSTILTTWPDINVTEWPAAASFETSVVSGYDTWCWGNTLSPNPHGPNCDPYNAASVLVRAKFPWARRCRLHYDVSDDDWRNAPIAYTAQYKTGGITGPNYTTWTGTPLSWVQQNGYTGDALKWEVQLWASGPSGTPGAGAAGWWSANSYGAEASPFSDGWRGTGPPLWQEGSPGILCPRYEPDSYPVEESFETKWRGGRAHYIVPYTPTAWP